MIRETAIVLLNITAISAASSVTGCSYTPAGDVEKERPMPKRAIDQVQQEYTDEWMAIPGVEGTAIGLFEGKPCIKVFSSRKADELRGKIPSTVEGYPVIIEETGAFRALEQQ